MIFQLNCFLFPKVDWRLRPLGLFVKHWAQRMDIHDGSRGRLSTYPLLLMLIQFLQCGCSPPVLPSLQARFPVSNCYLFFLSSNNNVVTFLPFNRKCSTTIVPWRNLTCVYSFHGQTWSVQTLPRWVSSLLDSSVTTTTSISGSGPSPCDVVILYRLTSLSDAFLLKNKLTPRLPLRYSWKVSSLSFWSKRLLIYLNFTSVPLRTLLSDERCPFALWWNSSGADSACLRTNRASSAGSTGTPTFTVDVAGECWLFLSVSQYIEEADVNSMINLSFQFVFHCLRGLTSSVRTSLLYR